MGDEDDVRAGAGGDRGEGAAAVRRQHVGHRRRPLGQVGAAAPAQPVDGPLPAVRRPVAPFGEDHQGAAVGHARRQPPDLLGPLAGGGRPVGGPAQERVRQPVGGDVRGRVQLQGGLHDHPRAALALAQQVADEQQRVARAGVPAEHDQRLVTGRRRLRLAGHRHRQPADPDRRPVHQVEEPGQHRVVARLVRLGLQPPAEPAGQPQAEEHGQRGGLAHRPDQPEDDHPQQPGTAHRARPVPPDQVVRGRQERHRRGQGGQGGADHHDQRHQQQPADRRGRQHQRCPASSVR